MNHSTCEVAPNRDTVRVQEVQGRTSSFGENTMPPQATLMALPASSLVCFSRRGVGLESVRPSMHGGVTAFTLV